MNKMVGRVFKRKWSLRKKRIVLFLLCLGMIFVFCANSEAAEKQPLRIGCVAPITGLFSGLGEPIGKGALLAAKLINEENGGILGRKVEILIRDDEMRPATGIRMARELNKQHGINLFTGVISSAVALALKPVMVEMNSLLLTAGAESTKITGKDWSPNVFRVSYDARTCSYAAAELLHKKYPQIKKWATIGGDYEYGHNCIEHFLDKFKQLDPTIEVVIQRWPKLGAGGGYGSHINAIMTTDAEGMFSSLFGGDLISFIREAKPFGLFNKMKVFGNGQMDWDNPYALGKDMVEIWAREMYYAPAYNNPLSKKFEKNMIQAYGENYFKLYQGHAGGGFDAVYAYKAAIEKAKSFDIEKIAKSLEDLIFDSPNGKKWIRAGDHQAYFDILYYHIVPDSKEEAGWKVDSWTLIDGKKNAIPVEEARKQ